MYGIGRTVRARTGLIVAGCLTFGVVSSVVFTGIAYADDGDDSASGVNGAPGKSGQANTDCRQRLRVDVFAPLQCTEYTPGKTHKAKVANGKNGAHGADNSRDENDAHGSDESGGVQSTDGSHGANGTADTDDNGTHDND